MLTLRLLPALRAGLIAAALAPCPVAMAQQPSSGREDAELAYAQCVRDHGYAEFPDPDPNGGFRFLVNLENAPRFRTAIEACRDLAPEGMRDEGVTAEQMEALVKLSQCIRENGVSEFPDPGPRGNYDLRGTGIKPGDTGLGAAMALCRDKAGPRGQGVRISIGG
jgi:hypothetical protein